MAEEKETSESGCEAEGGLNPVAVALALGGASRETADAFLNDQRALIADQRHHLHEQFKHLHLIVWEKQPGKADYWFARATHDAPSSPIAYHEWGKALLGRGQADAAIAKFTLANQKGPHFADALEGWGEALMAKNQSHKALAKFAETEKYAPNWGRLHLKWGEALAYTGKKDEAKARFARAATLDLTLSEKTELTRHP
jgi:tetratricopeptide (TPR) repeat protein